jgi:hypothetical protein
MQFDIDIDSEHRILFIAARKLLLDTYALVETKKERITSYSDRNGGVCHMRTMKNGIDIGFLKGARMQDKYGLLYGSGKVMKILSLKKIDPDCIQYYLDQALKINAQVK